jgi:ubiquinone/menaquinone biosynthesis C-methylase UbiE
MSHSDDYYLAMQRNTGWQQILASFARFVEPAPAGTLLDVGTGPGALVAIFQRDFGVHGIGVDASFALAHAAQQHYAESGATFITAALPRLPFADNTFDVLTATNILYLLDNPATALQEMERVLRPGGTFAMLNPSIKMNVATATALATERGLVGFAHQNFLEWGRIAERNHRWTLADVDALFTAAGLTLQTHRERIGAGLALYVKGFKRNTLS